ncbi:hypothetical protein IAE20_02830 [Acinetobacter sp. S54]|nr:hypothetical protein [Acinetobacter sp. S55]MBK0065833.1 hypothetical protein [Acinetobacter sp. S54]
MYKQKKFAITRGGWWPCEEKVLLSMLQDNYPVHQIADVLQRERMGVHTKIKILKKQGVLAS